MGGWPGSVRVPGRGALVRRSVRRHRDRVGWLRPVVGLEDTSRRVDLLAIGGPWLRFGDESEGVGARTLVARARRCHASSHRRGWLRVAWRDAEAGPSVRALRNMAVGGTAPV